MNANVQTAEFAPLSEHEMEMVVGGVEARITQYRYEHGTPGNTISLVDSGYWKP
jgi:hypothetical protein